MDHHVSAWAILEAQAALVNAARSVIRQVWAQVCVDGQHELHWLRWESVVCGPRRHDAFRALIDDLANAYGVDLYICGHQVTLSRASTAN